MISKKLMLLALGVLVIPFVVSQNVSISDSDYQDIDYFLENASEINRVLESEEVMLPGFASALIKNGNLLVELLEEEGEATYLYISIEDSRVKEMTVGEPENYNYLVSLDRVVADRILESDSPVDSISEAYKNGEINLSASGFGNKIKLFFAKLFSGNFI